MDAYLAESADTVVEVLECNLDVLDVFGLCDLTIAVGLGGAVHTGGVPIAEINAAMTLVGVPPERQREVASGVKLMAREFAAARKH